MHVENLSIIPEDGQQIAEIESPLEYGSAAEGNLMQYPPPPYHVNMFTISRIFDVLMQF